MKILKKSDVKEMEIFFNQVRKDQDIIVVWQFNPKENKRVIYNSTLNEANDNIGGLDFINNDNSERSSYEFVLADIYFYIEKIGRAHV